MLSLALLGQIDFKQNEITIERFRSRKEAALLIYLAHTGGTPSRAFLADLLWESSSTKQSLANLRTALARLRKLVPDELIATRKTVGLSPESIEATDSYHLMRVLGEIDVVNSAETAHTLQQALLTYRGPFLPEFVLSNASEFNAWVTMTREKISQQVSLAYEKLWRYHKQKQAVDPVMSTLRNWLLADELNEIANTAIIHQLQALERKSEAVAHYKQYAQQLREQLGIEPPSSLVRLMGGRTPSPTQKRVRRSATRHNLPREFDQFFDRESAQRDIHERFEQEWCRLITILGQGGMGKSRLAVTVARDRLDQHPDGVWFVALADIDPDDDDIGEAIATEIATILDLRLAGSATPEKQLIRHLQHKNMLLVLDNFENILDGTDLILDILNETEDVKLLVTSREALGVRAEWRVELSGLSYPTATTDEAPSDAMTLFEARYAQNQRRPLSADDVMAIRQVCRLVEGLPLALELAASLTQRQSCQTVANMLEAGLNTLTTKLRDMPRRHRSLNIVFDMSWQALSAELKPILARLSVFRGSFDAPAAAHIAGAHLYDLDDLCDKSLVMRLPDSNRYTLHAVTRAYAAEKLDPHDSAITKHARFFLAALAQQANALQQAAPQVAVAALEPDIDNIRLAWQVGMAQRLGDLLSAALAPLSNYYQLRGLSHEAEAAMRSLLKAASQWGDMKVLAASAAVELARFQNRLGRYPATVRTVQSAIQYAKAADDKWAEGMATIIWGEALWRQGNLVSAETKLQNALTIAHQLNATDLLGWCNHHLGVIAAIQTDFDQSLIYLETACAAWRQIRNLRALSGSLNSVGLVKKDQRNLVAAEAAFQEALTISQEIGERHQQALLLNSLSIIATEQNQLATAQNYLELGLDLAIKNSDLSSQGIINVNLAHNYRLSGKYTDAISHLETAFALFEKIGAQRLLSQTHAALNETINEQAKQKNLPS